MELKIQKWGNSAAVRLPSALLEQINAPIGSSLNADVRPDGVFLAPARRKYSLAELVSRCDPKAPIAADAGTWEGAEAIGREAW
ncbi:AbrB/MazE/SpoVT family DNA-binding domain-containing protein [Robbsia andropogonis]|uniref:AbrB/MazE/SpoVT family DNA-binding domain-containing protein n=1 Tax=Robbsia andropogonis TaxID=28092 RepID=UPI0004665B97|nr:AbrB/MazE/SpoVT family DNA-binding domain-containing protein [Robbsia andropogonis]MCP1120834.1 AbrB/MazE/SpoVT family DNA-binding domain-containing protein [Robbsia andropogonis]MCP1130627.1 AbrB/MazE/SpoVT family DNA-binding domain-containing protein [Robbsia andropogonis]